MKYTNGVKTRGEFSITLFGSDPILKTDSFAIHQDERVDLGRNIADELGLKMSGCENCEPNINQVRRQLLVRYGKDFFSSNMDRLSLDFVVEGQWFKYSLLFGNRRMISNIEVNDLEVLDNNMVRLAIQQVDRMFFNYLKNVPEEVSIA